MSNEENKTINLNYNNLNVSFCEYEYDSSIKNTTVNSTDKIGSSSSSSTGTYRANPGNVVQETTNTPRFGSATSKRSSGYNQEISEPTNLIEFKKYKQENGKNPFDESPSSLEKKIKDETKALEQTKDVIKKEAENNVLGKNLNIEG